MGIIVSLAGWTPEQILALKYITHDELCDEDDIVGTWVREVTEALKDAHGAEYAPSYVDVFEIRKEAYHCDCGDIDAFVAELELLMQYAKINDVVTVHYSPNAEGGEAGSGWAVVNSTCGLGGARWSNECLMRAYNELAAAVPATGRTRQEFVAAIIADYIAGTENAYEGYQNAGYEVAEGESDMDFIQRAAEQDYEDGPDGCIYAEYLTKEA